VRKGSEINHPARPEADVRSLKDPLSFLGSAMGVIVKRYRKAFSGCSIKKEPGKNIRGEA